MRQARLGSNSVSFPSDEPLGHTAFGDGGPGATTVAELRQKWGL